MNDTMKVVYNNFCFPFVPHDYQSRIVDELTGFDKALLPLRVGYGKTAIATWLGLYLACERGVTKLLFLVPATLTGQWAEWLQGIRVKGGDNLDVLLYQGTPGQRSNFSFDHDAIVMSHQIFRIDYKRLTKEFANDPTMFICYDESQDGLRKPANNIWRKFAFFSRNKPVLLMSGTPVSTPMDIYGVVKLLSPSIYTSKRHFEQCHVADTDFFGTVTAWKNLDMARRNLYLKSATLLPGEEKELPPVVRDKVEYTLTPKHLKVYKELLTEEILKNDKGEVFDATETARMFHLAQQIILAPEEYGLDITPAYLDLLWDIYNEDDSKLIIFGNYRSANRRVVDFFTKKKVGTVACFGDVSRSDKELNKAAFKNIPDCRVIVGNPRSLGVGTDGFQRVCYRVVFTEMPLTPDRFEQAEGRIDREGQSQPCSVKTLVAKGTIQQQLYGALMNKDDLRQAITERRQTLRQLFKI